MSHCVQRKRGNLFDDKDQGPPYMAEVERICSDATPDGSAASYSRHYGSYMSNMKPQDPDLIRKELEDASHARNPGLLGNVANAIRNVFAPPARKYANQEGNVVNSNNGNNGNVGNNGIPFPLQEQEWPVPEIEDEDDEKPVLRKEKSTGGSKSRTFRRRSRSLKRKPQRKVSRKKSKTRKSLPRKR